VLGAVDSQIERWIVKRQAMPIDVRHWLPQVWKKDVTLEWVDVKP
jgi:hypothetical protein